MANTLLMIVSPRSLVLLMSVLDCDCYTCLRRGVVSMNPPDTTECMS
jgi:hypothetical protein